MQMKASRLIELRHCWLCDRLHLEHLIHRFRHIGPYLTQKSIGSRHGLSCVLYNDEKKMKGLLCKAQVERWRKHIRHARIASCDGKQLLQEGTFLVTKILGWLFDAWKGPVNSWNSWMSFSVTRRSAKKSLTGRIQRLHCESSLSCGSY